jgi:tRNA pseudouridine38-40 synthase
MRNIRLLLAYDGTEYHGWERQKEFRTLQQTLEQAIQSLTGEPAAVIGSGRTDAGVHAIGQVANFRSDTRHDCVTIRRALNALLPDDFRVLAAEDVAESFHATYAVKTKLYRYAMHDGPVMDPLLRRYVCHCNWPMADAAMHVAAQSLIGTHDFSSFETTGAPRETSVRTITHIAVFRASPERLGWTDAVDMSRPADTGPDPAPSGSPPSALRPPPRPPFLFLEVAADGFLYNMVRAIAGTLINVGRAYWSAERVGEILTACDRTVAGPTAPAHGLLLVRVDY